MADEAARAVLERLLLRLQPPAGGEPGRGTLLVALAAEGDAGDAGTARCTATVAAAGEICSELRSEGIWRGMDEVLARFGARSARPRAAAPCCQRILDRAPLRLAFELSPRPGTLRAGCVALRRFIHGTSVVHPELAFHYCFCVDGAASSHAYGPARRESVCELGAARLLAQSRHFARPASAGDVPLCSKIHPAAGAPIGLRIPPAAAAAGISGELSVVPAAALCPCLKQYPNLPSRLASVALFCYDPAGLPAAPSQSRLFRDPSWLADWGRFGCSAAPAAVPVGEEDVVTPDAAFALQPGLAGADRRQTLLLFLFVRRADPFQVYDAWARRLLASHLEPTLLRSRAALQRGVRALLHPALEELGRRAQAQARLARCLPVALRAVSSVVAGSTSARFRRSCLRVLQAADTPALAAAARQSLADVTRRRWLPAGSCDAPRPREAEAEQPDVATSHRAPEPGPPPDAAGTQGEGSGEAAEQDRPGGPLRAAAAPPDARAPRTPGPPQRPDAPTPGPAAEGAAWLREVANLAEWAA